MIDVKIKNGSIEFIIGPHEIPVARKEAEYLASRLTRENIKLISSQEIKCTVGDWDIGPSIYWRTGRILARVGNKQWHLNWEEAIHLGQLFANVLTQK